MAVPDPKCNTDLPRVPPTLAGLTSPVQQAEMKLLLAGKWPPLKPLPIFKFESDDSRASIDFDKLRGEWLCRKTSLPSNKVQELRGGLIEIIMALPNGVLPHGPAEAVTECAAADQPEQELEKDASRRRQAILEWREKYENGRLYSGLRDYLSESQQNEIDDSIRLTLTARQLQCNAKNIAYVFDALAKADGKFATLIEIAQRNKSAQEAGLPANAEPAAPEADPPSWRPVSPSVWPPVWAPSWVEATNHTPDHRIESSALTPVEGFLEEPIESVFPEHERPSWAERIAPTTSQSSKIATPEFLNANPPLSVEEFREKVRRYPVDGFATQVRAGQIPMGKVPTGRIANGQVPTGEVPTGEVRTDNVPWSTDPIAPSPSRFHVLEISGFQVAAAVFLFAALSLAVWTTVGRVPVGKRLPTAQESTPVAAAPSPVPLTLPTETKSPTSPPPAANTSLMPEIKPAPPSAPGSRPETPSAPSLNARPQDSATRVAPPQPSPTVTTRSLADSGASPARPGSTALIARNTPPPANSQPAHSPRAVGPISAAPANPAPRTVTPVTPPIRAALHLSSPPTLLVNGAGDGSKPFRIVLPQTPIAASSSFAMTSQLSVFVSPEPGTASAHKPARLQPGGLVSYVWPRYPRPGDRYGSSETVKVRTTIVKLGQVQGVKFVSGSLSLFPAAVSAIRQWRYTPTLLNQRPVQAQQDVTIEFRPPQYVSRLPTHRTMSGGLK